jgi:cell division protein FtsX
LAVLVDFALENLQPTPQLKLFKLELLTPPTFLLVYGSLLLGFLAGWLGHMRHLKKLRRSPSTPEKPEAQPTQ